MDIIVPRRYASTWRLARKVRQHPISLVEHIPLLLNAHVCRVLVGVPVQPDLVSRVPHGRHILREGLQRVTGNEPGRLDVVLVKKLEETPSSNSTRPDTCVWSEHCTYSPATGRLTPTDVVRRVFAAV